MNPIPLILDTDSIILATSYESIRSSAEGTASFNGRENFGGNVNVVMGVASFSTNGQTGGSLSIESSFNSYKTYFTHKNVNSDLKPLTINEVKSKIEDLN